MIHVCKNPEMGGGFHFLAHGLRCLPPHHYCEQAAHLRRGSTYPTTSISSDDSVLLDVSWLETDSAEDSVPSLLDILSKAV